MGALTPALSRRERGAITTLTFVLLFSCGRSELERDTDASTPPSAHDAGPPDAGHDAGLPDSGTPDSGTPDAGTPLCPQSSDGGVITGGTPLGSTSFEYVWVGTEAPTTHSCPHVTVHAAHSPPRMLAAPDPLLAIDFIFPWGAALPGDFEGFGTFTAGTQTFQFGASAHVTRADGYTQGHLVPYEQWRTTLTFDALDAGFSLHGQVDTLECPGSTWECL